MTQPQDSIHPLAGLRDAAQLHVWPPGPPTGTVASTVVTSPLGQFGGLAECRKLTGLPVHVFVPQTPNGMLVIVHQGHGQHLSGIGVGSLIQDLVGLGCRVVGIVMQGGTETTSGSSGSHVGTTLSDHLTPIALALNTELAEWTPTLVCMTGISGGGWASVVYPGLDSRVHRSVSVAGYLPLYMSVPGRDTEQLAVGQMPTSYLDLAILAASNGRHVQLLHETDSCCFTRSQHDSQPPYEAEVAAAATAAGGSYSLTWVAQTPHEISEADRSIILAEFGLGPLEAAVIVQETQATLSGGWTAWNDRGNGGSIVTSPPDSGAEAVFASALSGTVGVRVTYVSHANRGPTVPYEVIDGATVVASGTIDQRTLPAGGWVDLGQHQCSSECKVRIHTVGAGGYVVADAVEFTSVDPTPPDPDPLPVPHSEQIEQHLVAIENAIAAIRALEAPQ